MNRFLREEKGDVVQYVLVLAVIIVILLFSFTKVKAMVKCTTERTVSAVSSIFGSKNEFNYGQCMGNVASENEDENGTNTGGGSGGDGNDGGIIENEDNSVPLSHFGKSDVDLTCTNTTAYDSFSISDNVPPQGIGTQSITVTNKKGWDMWIKVKSISTQNGLQITTNDPYYRKLKDGEDVIFQIGWKWNVEKEYVGEKGSAKVYFSVVCQEPPKEELYQPDVTAPKNFHVTNVNDASISLVWDKVDYATEYLLYRNGSLVYKGSSLNYVDNNLLPGTNYTYKLYTSITTGTSIFSTLQQKTTGISPIPTAPANIRLYNVTDTVFYVSWDYDDNVTHYRIFLDGKEIDTTPWVGYIKMDVVPNTTYNFGVIAENAYGSSEISNIYVKTNNISALKNPTNFRQISRTSTSQTIGWNAVAGALQYVIMVEGKELYRGPNTTFTQNNIRPGTYVHYFLYAVDGTKISSGVYRSMGVLGLFPPTASYDIKINNITNTSMKLSWKKGEFAETTIVKMNGKEVYNGTGTSINLNNLTPNTSYAFELQSVNDAGKSDIATIKVFTTNETYDDVSSLNATCMVGEYKQKFIVPSQIKIGEAGVFILETVNTTTSNLDIKITTINRTGGLFEGSTPVTLEYDDSSVTIKPKEKFSIPIRWSLPANADSSYEKQTGEIEVVLNTSC